MCPSCQFLERSSINRLMSLGHFARNDRLARTAERARQIHQHVGNAMGRFEEDERAGFACQSGKLGATLTLAGR